MRCNVGGRDRAARLILGTVLFLAAVLSPVDLGWKISLVALAAVVLLTGLSAYCPLNHVLGINTCTKTLP